MIELKNEAVMSSDGVLALLAVVGSSWVEADSCSVVDIF